MPSRLQTPPAQAPARTTASSCLSGRPRLPALRWLPPLLLVAGALAGCAGAKGAMPVAFDLGPLAPIVSDTVVAAKTAGNVTAASPTPGALPAIAPIVVADVTAAPWLDTEAMVFRLSYENDQQPRPYANSRWSMTPPQLLGQRIKARLAQAGATVASPADGALGLPLLRIEADDFSQRFASVNRSAVHVAWRASVLNGRRLVAQRSFEQVRAAPSADAAGGASALAAATDSLIGELMQWLASLPPRR